MNTNNEAKHQTSTDVHFGANTCGCSVETLPDSIHRRAYQLFEMRGRQSGHELEDWLQAEREEKARVGI